MRTDKMNNMKRRKFILASSSLSLLSPYLWSQENAAKIKIAQIGTGHPHASGKMAAIRKYPDIFEVVGIAEADPKRRKSAENHKAYKNLKWMSVEDLLAVDGLQAVAVETDVKELVPTAMKCIKAGKHIHLDKPAGEELGPVVELHKEADKRGLTIQMGYMLRYNPAFEFMFQAIRDGWLGEITEINGMMGKKASDALRKDLSRFRGGGMFELACHLIDAAVTIAGKPDKVTAFTHRTYPEKDKFADNQLAVLDYKKAIVTIRCNHIDPMGFKRRMFSVTGTQGTIEIAPLEPAKLRLSLDRPRGKYKKGSQDVVLIKRPGRYDLEFLDLAKIIRGKKKLAWDSKHDIAVHETVLRASGMLK